MANYRVLWGNFLDMFCFLQLPSYKMPKSNKIVPFITI